MVEWQRPRPFHSITMLSERGICDSCRDVMRQFQQAHPDVRINMVSGKQVEKGWKRNGNLQQ